MNDRERLLALLAGEPVDHRPFVVTGGGMTMVVADLFEAMDDCPAEGYFEAAPMASLTLAAHDRAGVGNVGVPFCMTAEAEGLGAGIVPGSKDIEPRVSSYPLKAVGDANSLLAFDPAADTAGASVVAVRILKERAPDVPVIANVSGGATLAATLVEPLDFMRALIRDPEAAHRLVRATTEACGSFGDALVAAGADVVCIGESSATGDILGPTAFDTFVVPYVNGLIERFHGAGVPVIFHACGDVRRLRGALPRVQAEAFSVDSVVPLKDLRAQVEGRPTMGNVATQLLHLGRRDTIREAAESCFGQGVDILAPACGISPKTPLANLACLAEVAADSGPWQAACA